MSEAVERLARIISSDGSGDIKRTLSVCRSDIYSVLSQFCDVNKLYLDAVRDGEGYTVTVTAKVSRIFDVGKTTAEE